MLVRWPLEMRRALMNIDVKVHPGSRSVSIVSKGNMLEVYLTEPAESNKANLQLLKVLRKEFGCDVRLVSGFTSKRKTVMLDMSESDFNEILKSRSHARRAH